MEDLEKPANDTPEVSPPETTDQQADSSTETTAETSADATSPADPAAEPTQDGQTAAETTETPATTDQTPPAEPAPETPADAAATSESAPADAGKKIGDADDDLPTVPDEHTWKLIQDARRREARAEADVIELSEELKEAKKRHDKASEELGKLIDEAQNPNLFSQTPKKKKAEDTPAEKSPADLPGKVISSPDTSDDSWRSVSVNELELPDSIKQKLHSVFGKGERDATISDLADHSQRNFENRLTDLDGIGEKSAQKIEDALDKFWIKRAGEKQSPAPEDSTAETPADTTAAEPTDEAGPAGTDGQLLTEEQQLIQQIGDVIHDRMIFIGFSEDQLQSDAAAKVAEKVTAVVMELKPDENLVDALKQRTKEQLQADLNGVKSRLTDDWFIDIALEQGLKVETAAK